MKTFRVSTLFIALSLVLSGSFTLVRPNHALAANTVAISVSPPRFELFGNPGDNLSEKIKVNNTSDGEITYTVSVEDFVATGEEGQVDFRDPATNKTTYSLANWVSVEPTRFTVAAGKDYTLNFTVRIPKNAEPGGHYASVQITIAGGSVPGGGASVASRVGSLILLRVSGATTEKLTLENFDTDNNYYPTGPVTFNLRSKNEGNVHVAPTGTIVITDIFGRKVKEIPLTQANVLPGAVRQVKTVWDQKNMVGRFTASLVATYGQQHQTLAASTTFIVFPVWLIFTSIGVLIIIFLLITQRKRLKRLINNLTSD
jgi:hypothetical protein